MNLRDRVAALAEEYQREQRQLSSQAVGRMMAEWLDDDPPVDLTEVAKRAHLRGQADERALTELLGPVPE
jgi:hypothetical protein